MLANGYFDQAWLQKLITHPLGTVETPPNGVTVDAIGDVPGKTIHA